MAHIIWLILYGSYELNHMALILKTDLVYSAFLKIKWVYCKETDNLRFRIL